MASEAVTEYDDSGRLGGRYSYSCRPLDDSGRGAAAECEAPSLPWKGWFVPRKVRSEGAFVEVAEYGLLKFKGERGDANNERLLRRLRGDGEERSTTGAFCLGVVGEPLVNSGDVGIEVGSL